MDLIAFAIYVFFITFFVVLAVMRVFSARKIVKMALVAITVVNVGLMYRERIRVALFVTFDPMKISCSEDPSWPVAIKNQILVVINSAGDTYQSIRASVDPINSAFCSSSNCVIVHCVCRVDEQRWNMWSKIPLMHRALTETDFEWVAVLDADIVFTNSSITLQTLVNWGAGKDLLIGPEWSKLSVVNTGLLLMRNTQWSREFLPLVWDTGAEIDKKTEWLHEQASISRLYETRQDVRDHVGILPWEMAPKLYREEGIFEGCWVPGDFAAHIASGNKLKRLKSLLDTLERTRQ